MPLVIKKGTQTVDQFVMEIAGISDALAVAGGKVTNGELLMAILFGLG